MSTPPTLSTLAAQLNALSGDDAASLLDALNSLRDRAEVARAERIAAEAERDARYPRCGCGKPATRMVTLSCEQQTIEPGTDRPYVRGDGPRPLRGGIIADHYDSGYAVPQGERSDRPLYIRDGDAYREIDPTKVAWVTCEEEACRWVLVPDCADLVVGWKD